MPKRTRPKAAAVYAAADRFVDAAFRSDDSLFTPGRSIWTAAVVDELYECLPGTPDTGDRSFLDKLRDQLDGSSDEAIQGMAELIFFHLLATVTSGAQVKRENIDAILGWCSEPVEIPDDLVPALDHGLVNPGTHFNTRRDAQLSFLLELLRAWKALPVAQRESLLLEPWEFKDLAYRVPHWSAYTQRNAVLHLLFPDTFESIVSRSDKELITKRFSAYVTSPTEDVDRALLQVRAGLAPEHGPDFDFYDPPVVDLWRKPKSAKVTPPGDEDDGGPEDPPDNPPGTDLRALADELCVPDGFLDEIVTLIRRKRQVIFHGPPGTGKTYIARKLAKHLVGATGSVETVQFHPSYTYEDFVEGFRPTTDGSGFALREGPLKRLARRAMEHPESPHVLVIDELNRGNVAKVFGELYFLLEYREEGLSLQYSDQPFRLPDNLWIIATMNEADRSIALLDGALRRRFQFFAFEPDRGPIAGVLRQWLNRHRPEMVEVADLVDRVNASLADRHAEVGPSYFMQPDLDEAWLALTWRHAVLPYLAEQFFGDDEGLARYELAALRSAGSAGVEQLATAEPAESPEVQDQPPTTPS